MNTYRYIESPNAKSEVLVWFENNQDTKVIAIEKCTYITYKDYVIDKSIKNYNKKDLPLIAVYSPRVIKKRIWTVGEIHILPTKIRNKYPELTKIEIEFKKWLISHECVFSNTKGGKVNEYNYYFEGSVINWDSKIYAMESGKEALLNEQYFVDDDISIGKLEDIYRILKLRGIEIENA